MRFFVNVDHVATVRQARRTVEPDPVEAAMACERAGADGITVHLREDRRHIQDDDVRRLSDVVTTVLNLELATSPDIVALASQLRPYQVTFVPERRQEVTTEGGLDLTSHRGGPDPRLAAAVAQLQQRGIHVSLFIDPDLVAVRQAADLGVDAVELHTGPYANAFPATEQPLAQLLQATAAAATRGLTVHAGHGLTYANVTSVAAIPQLDELNIGHSIVSRAVFVGMEHAVREMGQRIATARVD